MNYKVAKTGLILCIVYLVAFYILKFFYPDILLQAITSPTLIRLGEFMNEYTFAMEIIKVSASFLTYYLFVCACSGKFKLSWIELLYVIIGTLVAKLCILFLPNLYTHTSISVMLILSLLCKGKLLNTTLSFVIHGYLSQFLTSIRGFETIIVYVNSISGLLFNLEAYVWLILLAIIFYFKEEKKNG